MAAAALVAGCGGGSDSGATAKQASGATNGGVSTTNEGSNTTAGIVGAGTKAERLLADLSEELDEGGAPLSKAQLIRDGDKVCRRGGSRIQTEMQRHKTEYGAGFGKHPNQKQKEEATVDLVLPVIQAEAEALAQLSAPPGDEKEIVAIVEALEKGVATTEAKPSRAFAEGENNPLDEASKLSQRYGFKICGS